MKRFWGFCEKEKGSKDSTKNIIQPSKGSMKRSKRSLKESLLPSFQFPIFSYTSIHRLELKGNFWQFSFYIRGASLAVEAKLAKPKLSRDHRREITFDSSRHQNQALPLAFLKLPCKPFLEGEYLPNGWIWATRWEVWDILRCLLLATKVYISIQCFQLSNFP